MTLCVAFHDERAAYVLGDSLVTTGTWYQPYSQHTSVGEVLPIDGPEFYTESVLKLWKGRRHVTAVAGDQSIASTLIRKLNSSGLSPEHFVNNVERFCGAGSAHIEVIVAFNDGGRRPRISCWRPNAGRQTDLAYCAIGNTGASDLYNVAFRLGSEVRRYEDISIAGVLQAWVGGVQAAALKLRTLEGMEGIGGVFVGASIAPEGSAWVNDFSFSRYESLPTMRDEAADIDSLESWESLRSVSIHVRDHITYVGPCMVDGVGRLKLMPAVHLRACDISHRVKRDAPQVARAAFLRSRMSHAFTREGDGATVIALAGADASTPLVEWEERARRVRLRADMHRVLSSMPRVEIPDAVSIVIARASHRSVRADAIVVGIMGNVNTRFLTAGESSGSTTSGTGEGPKSVDVVQEGVEREIESDQSVCASGIDQGPSEHDEEVPLTPPRHLTPLS